MKGKFRILRRIGLGVFMVCALMLAFMPVAPVSAATAVTDVWVEFPAEDAAGANPTTYNVTGTEALYRIHFKPTTALVRGVDTITVQFPDGADTTMGPSGEAFTLGAACATETYFDIMVDPYAAGKTYKDYHNCTAAVYGGYRVTVTIDVDIAAGQEAWLLIDDEDTMVTGGAANTTAYKVKVHTSKDTTPVLSKGFYLGTSGDQVNPGSSAVSVSPSTAGSTAQYTFEWDNNSTGELTANTDTITVTFPYGTTVPSSISASSVQVYNGSWSTCGLAPIVDTDLGTVKVTTPCTIATDDADAAVKFLSTAGIANPTYGYTAWGFTTTKSRVGFIRTTDAAQDVVCDDDGYTIDERAATTLDFDYGTVTGYSDKYTMINMYSSPLYLQVEDTYGNLCNTGGYVSAEVTLSSSSGTGSFYYDGNNTEDDGTGAMTLISATVTLSSGAKKIYYKDSSAGTHTLTASYSGLTSATWTIQVCPAVSLYDRYDNLVNTYKPPAATPVEESNDTTVTDYRLGSYYVQQAISAATAYDKVVLGDGHYETDVTSQRGKLQINGDYITLKSLNGADYTTIDARDVATGQNMILVNYGANYVTIEDLTFQGNKSVAWGLGIFCKNSDGFTFQNLKFIDVPSDSIAVSPEQASDTILSGTITNNTITGIGRRHGESYEVGGIRVQSYTSNAVTAVKITNNTISDCYGDLSTAIVVNEHSGEVTNITVQGNTISDCYRGILIEDGVTGLTGTRAIANNSITGCVEGVKVKDANDVAFDLVKNTITNNKLYGIYFNNATLAAQTIDIKYNDISGNGTWGIYNTYTAGADVVAKYNWWGDATGPGAGTGTYASLTARGSGDNVSVEATWEPWLHKSLTDVVADNASYQAADMKLVVGWNTLSTPVQLIAAADTVQELIPSGMTIGYYYDGGWQQITTDYTLSPCDAVYVKMSAVTYVLLKFDAGAFTTPSKDLAAGWNLISLAYLSSSGMTDLATVASVAKTAANLPGYSQLVSPSLNAAQTDLYGTTRTSWAYAYGQSGGTYSCYPGLGYWVYMQNAATLAGFEITPIVPAFGL